MQTFDLAELLSKRGAEVKQEEAGKSEAKFTAPPKEEQGEFHSIIEANLLGNASEGQVVHDTNGTGTGIGSRPFFGSDKGNPQYVLQQEKAHHRVILYELAMGKKAGEIAKEFGFTPAMVYYVEKQPWAKDFVKGLIQQHGGDKVEQTLKGAAQDSADLLAQTVRDKDCDIRVRSQNAKEILDRIYGKSQQIINHRNLDPSDISDEDLARSITTGTGGQ